MKNSRDMLEGILKTVQMGQVGIRSVLDTSMRPGLRKALENQLRELDTIESEAHVIASQRGWDLPELDPAWVIRSFGAVRPNPYRDSGESLHDFCIENPGPGFYSLIGVKTPGLTCAHELGMHLANRAAEYLKAQPNPGFDPHRRAITGNGTADDFEIICRCEKITRGQILEAIGRGAKTVEAVKRRLGTGMGRCQGSRCGWLIAKILKETGADPEPLF